MSDNQRDMPSYVSGLAVAINQTYSYSSGSSLFISMIPSYLKDYGNRYIIPSCQWLDGYVIGFHDSTMEIPSTRIAASLITGITKNIVGEDIVFKSADTDFNIAKKTLEFVNNWARENNIIQSIYAGIGFAGALGTATLKANKTIDQKIWWEAVRLDNSFFLTDFKGDVIDATFNIRGYTDTRKGKNNDQYFLVEHRYYDTCDKPLIKYNKNTGESIVVKRKGEKTPMVCYEVHRAKGTSMTNTMSSATSSTSVNWEELPKNIRDMIKRDYAVIKIKKPLQLGLIDLGVVQLKRGRIDLAVPTAGSFGESMIIKLISDFITYEYANACRLRDMYLGKGNVYTPKNLSMGDLNGASEIAKGGVLHSMPTSPITLIPGIDPDKQKVFSEQFQVRGEEWQNIMNDCLKTIATKLGMTPKVIAAYLSGGAMQQTATQIDSEDDQNIAFINLERSFYKNALNKLLKTTLAFYGYPCNVSLEFASPSLLNKDRLLERVIKELDEGLIDVEEAVRTLNPDLEENAIRSKVESAKFLHEQKSNQEMANLDPFGDLGNEI
jgi:hypothetical protein